MSGIIALSAALSAAMTAATVVIATLPGAQALLSPLTDGRKRIRSRRRIHSRVGLGPRSYDSPRRLGP